MSLSILLLAASPQGSVSELGRIAAEGAAIQATQGWNCDNPTVQQEMNFCADQEYLEADAELNAQWKVTSEAMKRMDAESTNLSWDKRPGYFETLLEAQRAWIAFRDAHCTSEGYIFRGGSMEPLMVSTCKTALTEARTTQLRDLVEVE